jgi:hypothetical protein
MSKLSGEDEELVKDNPFLNPFLYELQKTQHRHASNTHFLKGEFVKVNKATKTAWGWFYVSKENGEYVPDYSGDTWDIEDVQKTAHDFVCECRVGGEAHIFKGGAELVESIVFTKELQDILGIDLNKEGWFGAFRILDPDLLEKVEKRDYLMFSIGGTGLREEVED